MSKRQMSKADRFWQLERRRVRKVARGNRRRVNKVAQDARRRVKRVREGKIKIRR